MLNSQASQDITSQPLTQPLTQHTLTMTQPTQQPLSQQSELSQVVHN